jgi:hypothetical protein
MCGEEDVLASIGSRLATAPKDRSADYLMWVAAEHPDQRETRAVCGRVSVSKCLTMFMDLSRSLPDRAVAAWFCSGINYPFQHRVGAGDLARLADAYCRLGAPTSLRSMISPRILAFPSVAIAIAEPFFAFSAT